MTYPTHLLPTTVVGSYPQPDWLVDRGALTRTACRARARTTCGASPSRWLEQAQDDATILAIREMERAGIDIVTRRRDPPRELLEPVRAGAGGHRRRHPGQVRAQRGGSTPVPRVVGQDPPPRPGRSARRGVPAAPTPTARRRSRCPARSPCRSRPRTSSMRDDEEMAMDYAVAVNEELRALKATGVDVMQLDEPWVRTAPEKAARYGVRAINRALEGIAGPTVVHLCFGYAAVVPRTSRAATRFCRSLPIRSREQISIEAAQPRLDLGVLRNCRARRSCSGVLDLGDPGGRDGGGGRRADRARGCSHVAAERLDRRAGLRHEIPAARARLRQVAGAGGGRRDRAARAGGMKSRSGAVLPSAGSGGLFSR